MHYNQPMGMGRLPVSPEQVDGRNFINDERDLPRLNLNFGQLGQFAFDLVKALVVEIQNNAERNAFRCFAFNFFSANRFNNQQFTELTQVFVVHVQHLCMEQRGADPLQVIAGEVGPVVESASGFLVSQFPDLGRYVPAEGEDVIRTSVRNWEYLLTRAQNSLRGGSSGGMGGGMGGGRSYSGVSGGMGGSFGMAPPRSNEMGLNRGSWSSARPEPAPAMAQRDIRPNWETRANPPARGMGQSNIGDMGMSRWTPTQEAPIVKSDIQPTQAPTSTASATATKPLVPTQPSEAPSGSPTTTQGATPMSSYQSGPYDHWVMPDGRQVSAIWRYYGQVNQKPGKPRPVFNQATHMRFIERLPDGEANMVIVPRVPEMNYLQHEINNELKALYRSNLSMFDPEPAPVDLLKTRQLVPNQSGSVAALVTPEKREELDAADAPRQLVKTIVSASLSEATQRARLEANRTLLEADPTNKPEYLEFIVEEVKCSSLRPGALDAVQKLRQADGFLAFKKQLLEAHQKDDIDDELFDALARRATDCFYRYCKVIFRVGHWTDNFMDDIDEFLKMIEAKYGETMFGLFNKGAKFVIRMITAALTGDSLTHYMATFPEEDRKTFDKPAFLVDRYSVTEVPWTGEQIGRQWRMGGIVTNEHAAELKKALDAIFARTSTNDVQEHVIMSSDGYPFFAYYSPFDAASYMMDSYYQYRIEGEKRPVEQWGGPKFDSDTPTIA